jgi:hypothetical protein
MSKIAKTGWFWDSGKLKEAIYVNLKESLRRSNAKSSSMARK